MINLLLNLYALSALLLALYTMGHAVLLIQYLRHGRQTVISPDIETLPAVTVQLPIYNERYVALRLIDAVAALDYPKDKLHIQILDDSDDATTSIIASHLRHYRHVHIEHIRRPMRSGYKAGALAYGLSRTQNPFVAIFDADFIPPPDFLRRTMPHFTHQPDLGFIQTRWGHLNPKSNWLTRAQVLSIDNHFIIEQAGRNLTGWLLPFNGTGGVWRTRAIHDAGNWSDDTLTEDLDLSFRAQLRGWKSLYLHDIVVPGEVPPQLAAYRQQQARWAKGSSQAFRKLIVPLWFSNKSIITKLMATQPLVQFVPHLLMLLMLLVSPLLILSRDLSSLPLAPLGLIGLVPPVMYLVSQQKIAGDWGQRLLAFPVLLLISTGLIWQNAYAVLAGFVQTKSEFHRTPKFISHWHNSHYAVRAQIAIIIQGFLMAYSLWGAFIAWQHDMVFLPYFLIHILSFATVTVWDSLDQWRIVQQLARPRLLPESGND